MITPIITAQSFLRTQPQLTPAAFTVLATVAYGHSKQTPYTAQQIGEQTRLDYIRNQLAYLFKNQYITRSKNKNEYTYTLTPLGTTVIQDYKTHHKKALKNL